MKRKYDRRYPTTGGSYNSPHREESRRAKVEDRLVPKQVWVRCCNKMHPVRITKSGKLSIPAHKNLKAERMMVKMGAKEPRCVTILRLWKGNPIISDRGPDDEPMPRNYYSIHKQLAKHLPKELERAYAGGLKHNTGRYQKVIYESKTPLFKDKMRWNLGDVDTGLYWFREVLPQMAMERLLLRELWKTPQVVMHFKGKTPKGGYIEVEPRKWKDEDDGYYGQSPYLSVETMDPYWCDEGEKNKLIKVSASLDRSFWKLALNGKNRLKDGSLIVGMIRFGSHRHTVIASRNPLVGDSDIYIALTKSDTGVNNSNITLNTEQGIIDDKGDWICLKQE